MGHVNTNTAMGFVPSTGIANALVMSEGFNYRYVCGKKIPKGDIICESCNRGDD